MSYDHDKWERDFRRYKVKAIVVLVLKCLAWFVAGCVASYLLKNL